MSGPHIQTSFQTVLVWAVAEDPGNQAVASLDYSYYYCYCCYSFSISSDHSALKNNALK